MTLQVIWEGDPYVKNTVWNEHYVVIIYELAERTLSL